MPKRAVSDRFWEKVSKDGPLHPRLGTNCWVWVFGRHKKSGYGEFWYMGRRHNAHRIAYELEFGSIPEGEGYHGTIVRHRCDNPACVRPDHLELGTAADNCRDRDERGRHIALRGEAHPDAKVTEAQVRDIRIWYRTGIFSQTDIAQRFGITQTVVSDIVAKRSWKHVADNTVGEARHV